MQQPRTWAGLACLAAGLAAGLAIGARRDAPNRQSVQSVPGPQRSRRRRNGAAAPPRRNRDRILLLVTGEVETKLIVAALGCVMCEGGSGGGGGGQQGSPHTVPFGEMFRGDRVDVFSMGDLVGSEPVITALVGI